MNRRDFLQKATCATFGMAAGLTTLGLTPQEAVARGASAEESARAQRILAQTAAPQTRMTPSGSGAISIAPGGSLRFESTWFCLDPALAVPSDDEPMAFRPMSNYIAPELRALYLALMRSVCGKPPSNIDMQQIVYHIRSERGPTILLKSKEYAYANKVLPRGEALLRTAARPPRYVAAEGLHLWASKPKPPSIQRYSMLRSDGVAGEGLCLDSSTVRGIVANASSKAFVFDPCQWVLESSRDVQAVTITRPTLLRVGKGHAAPVPEPQAQEPSPQQEKPAQKGVPKDGFAGH